jgi:AcrR family transcriptional regulator
MKEAILGAAIEVVALHGLNNWTVEEVANRARCAKGLVNYHYRSKQELLVQVAHTIRDDRSARRLASIQTAGTQALDRLWTALTGEIESGWFAAWISLLAADGLLREAARANPRDTLAFADGLGRALDLEDTLVPRAALIDAALNGLQLSLLQGASPRAMEEDYHRFWLTVLP